MDFSTNNNSENAIFKDIEYDNTIDPIETNYNKSKKTTSRKRAFSIPLPSTFRLQ